MPFIMAATLIDMISIGIIIPVMPVLVGQFTASQSEQAFWFGAVTFTFAVANFFASPILGALSDRARGDRLHIVESFGSDAPSTKAAASVIASLTSGRKVLVVIERDDELAQKSVRNLKDLHVITPDQLNAYDVLVSDDIVFTKSAYERFVASKTKKEEVER